MVSPAVEASQPTGAESISEDDPLGLSETHSLAKEAQAEPATLSSVPLVPAAPTPPLSPRSTVSASPSEPPAKGTWPDTSKPQSSASRSLSDLSSLETNPAIGWTNSLPAPTVSDDTNMLFTGQPGNHDLLQALSTLLTSGGWGKPAPRLEQTRRRSVVVCLANPEDVTVVEEALSLHDYEITVASSPEQVTSMLQTSHLLDILLLDPNFHAGQHGGATIMRYVNMLNPVRRRRVFVVVTSHSYRTQDLQAAFVHGVNLVLNTHDLAALPNILSKSIQDFNDLYRAFNQVSGISSF